MKALAIVERFGFENLRWIERPVPEPGPDDAVVRIAAATLNFRDVDIVEGRRNLALPLIPVSDACGTVTAIGARVRGLAVGDRVMPTFVQGWLAGPPPQDEVLPTLGGPLDGVLREYGVWPETGLVRAPDCLSDLEAAALPCAALSAWNALFVATRIGPGDTVLVQGTGGVALFALAFAKLAGAAAIVTSSSDEKLARVAALGADATINYLREPEWGARARALAGAGVDCVVEIGGAATLAQSIAAVRAGGTISAVGFVSGRDTRLDVAELNRKSVRLVGVRVGNRASFTEMCRAIERHRLKPVIDSHFAFADAIDALRRFRAGGHFGKIGVTFG